MKGWTLAHIRNLESKGMVTPEPGKRYNVIDDVPETVLKPVKNIPKIKPGNPEEQRIMGTVPSKSNCYRIVRIDGHGSLAKTKSLEAYEESFMWQCGKYRNIGISTPFEIYINVFYPSKRSDLDNSLKIVLDCLQRIGAITNDNNCCKIVAQKFIDKDNPRIEFKIEPV